MNHVRFRPPRKVAEYVGQAGHESNGQRIPTYVYDALSASKTSRIPMEFVVIGEYRRDDGASFLDFGSTTEHIETVTDYRWDGEAKRLRVICPACGLKDGRHTKVCDHR